MRLYKIFTNIDQQECIQCHLCDKVSHNPNDVREHYCGYCCVFLDFIAEAANLCPSPEIAMRLGQFLIQEAVRAKPELGPQALRPFLAGRRRGLPPSAL